MTNPARTLSNDGGQMTLEMTLIIAVLLGAAITVAKTARSDKWMQTLVSGPWLPVKAMIENGTWIAQNANSYNPSMMSRHGTYRGDDVQGAAESDDPGQ
jgi:hypothetical protein